jgi:hypothetical protein
MLQTGSVAYGGENGWILLTAVLPKYSGRPGNSLKQIAWRWCCFKLKFADILIEKRGEIQ